tara:strand:+ start:691 stop:2472 length:1782 start_codon:yes stop_codon:yes gene_type:complete
MEFTTSFQHDLNEELQKQLKLFDASESFLKTYQEIPLHYLKKNVRGLLVYQEMGTGKSILAAAIANTFAAQNYKVVFLSAKALHSNFEKNTKFYAEKTGTEPTPVTYVTSNSSNIYDKLRDILDDSVLIVDEAHNLFNTITNGSKNMMKVYDLIMATKNIKIIFLTGSVLVNEPFELVPCFNMLAGYLRKKNTLFPEIREYFNEEFVGPNGFIKNKAKFQDRVTGYVTYQGSTYDPTKKREGFPDALPDKIIKLKMSEYQLQQYQLAKNLEDQERNMKVKSYDRMTKPKSKSYSSYRIKTRQMCNFVFPEGITITTITDEHLKDIMKYGPKFHSIYENVEKHPNNLHLFYSFFVEGPGSGIMSKYLEYKGYSKYNAKAPAAKSYAMINGSVPVEERDEIVKAFNSEENKNGKLIRILLISETAIEGLDLKNIRHIYQLEPAWNLRVTDQLKARGVRLNSHTMLPEKERNVQFYIYLMDLDGISTDEDMYRLSMKKAHTNESFLNALVESAIDCELFNKNPKITCRSCYPSGKRLYTDDFYTDINVPSKCKSEETVEAEEVKINGKTYYKYNKRLFQYDKEADAYIPVKNFTIE